MVFYTCTGMYRENPENSSKSPGILEAGPGHTS